MFAIIRDLHTFVSNVASDQQNCIPDIYCKSTMLDKNLEKINM